MNRLGLRATYTVATLDVPPTYFDFIAQKLKEAGYGHAFMEEHLIDMSGVALTPNPDIPESAWRLSKDNAAAVSCIKFMPITDHTPRVKCILQGPYNMPVIANYDGDPQWKGWYPLPDILRDEDKK